MLHLRGTHCGGGDFAEGGSGDGDRRRGRGRLRRGWAGSDARVRRRDHDAGFVLDAACRGEDGAPACVVQRVELEESDGMGGGVEGGGGWLGEQGGGGFQDGEEGGAVG